MPQNAAMPLFRLSLIAAGLCLATAALAQSGTEPQPISPIGLAEVLSRPASSRLSVPRTQGHVDLKGKAFYIAEYRVMVDQAGETMTEVVSSIRRVTDIMGEISAASNEQSAGVSQVGEAVQQIDQVTQQNAALVEQMAAAASSLKALANEQVQAVAVFRLPSGAMQSRALALR